MILDFNIGDEVRLRASYRSDNKQPVGIITDTDGDFYIVKWTELKGSQQSGGRYGARNLEHSFNDSNYHAHHDLIIKWAKGAIIQFLNLNGDWVDVPEDNPKWLASVIYRVKPTKSPELVKAEQELDNLLKQVEVVKETIQKLSEDA